MAVAQGGHATALSLHTLLHLLYTSFSSCTCFLPLLLNMGVAYSVGEVDHLYTFFVKWSPEIYTKDPKPHYLVVKKDKLVAIDDNLLHVPTPYTKHWELLHKGEGGGFITMRPMPDNIKVLFFASQCLEPYVQIVKVTETKCHHSSEEPDEPEDLLPVLEDHSQLLEDHHIQSLANHLPARTQGYPWRLVYSLAIHGTSLKSLYREMAELDCPVLLVIKDMQNKVFGAFSSDPFKVKDCCYGTGETFLYSFNPEFKAYRWSGENSYFVRGHLDSLQIGGGGGRFGLWLDSDLYKGSSFTCHTFRNQPLATKQDFKIQDLEVWTVQ